MGELGVRGPQMLNTRVVEVDQNGHVVNWEVESDMFASAYDFIRKG